VAAYRSPVPAPVEPEVPIPSPGPEDDEITAVEGHRDDKEAAS